MTTPIGIVTGLQMEADIARGLPGCNVLCYGPGPEKARAAAEALIEQGVSGLISFGIAGGLDPTLVAGSIVMPRLASVIHFFASQPDYEIFMGQVITVEAPALTPDEKLALRASTKACAVDMESQAIEDVAAAHTTAYTFIRAICDEAGDTIPRSALSGMAPDGKARPIKVAAQLITQPNDLPGLLHLGKQQKKALAALRDFVAFKPDLPALLG